MLSDRQEGFLYDGLKKISESLSQQTKFIKELNDTLNIVFADQIKENAGKAEKRKQEEATKKKAIKDQFIEEWNKSDINTGDTVTIEIDDKKIELFIVKYVGNTNIKGYIMAYTREEYAFDCLSKDTNGLGKKLVEFFAPQKSAKIISHDRKVTSPVRSSVYRMIRRKQ